MIAQNRQFSNYLALQQGHLLVNIHQMVNFLPIFKLLLYLVGSFHLALLFALPRNSRGGLKYIKTIFAGFSIYLFGYLLFYATANIYIARAIPVSGVVVNYSTLMFFVENDRWKFHKSILKTFSWLSVLMFIITLCTNVYPNPRLVSGQFMSDVNIFTHMFTMYMGAGLIMIVINNVHRASEKREIYLLALSFTIFSIIALAMDAILPTINPNIGPIFLIGPISSAIFTGVFFYQVHRASDLEMSQSITRFAFVFLCLMAFGALFLMESTLSLVRYAAFLLLILVAAVVYNILRREQVQHKTLQVDHLATVSYLADIAHRLKTPLAVIDLKADSALAGHHNGQDTLAEIKQISHNTAVTMKNIIQTSKIDYGLAHLDRVSLDLSDLLQNMESELRDLAPRHTLQLALAPNIWARIDQDRLREAIYNLVDNATKFSPAKSTISISLSVKADTAIIQIKDQGTGIDKETKDHLFERHFQAEDGRQHTGSAGLGLSITKWIIEAHGGNIAVESQLDHGSAFIITLPALEKSLTVARGSVKKHVVRA